jgi:transcriptional regulator with XRE-family HTH domain
VTDEQLSAAVSTEVRRLLDERGMSGNQLAKAAGLEQTTVARKLRGVRSFDLDDLAAIAPVLEVTAAELVEWAQRA